MNRSLKLWILSGGFIEKLSVSAWVLSQKDLVYDAFYFGKSCGRKGRRGVAKKEEVVAISTVAAVKFQEYAQKAHYLLTVLLNSVVVAFVEEDRRRSQKKG